MISLFRGRFTCFGATIVFGGIGLALMGLATRWAMELRRELESWPRVQAGVDSAGVTSPTHPRRDVYAARLWLTYTYDGWNYVSPVTEGVYQNDYGSAVSRSEAAARKGTAQVMLDPQHPRAVQLDPGYSWRFFFGPLIFGGLGAVFGAFGLMSMVLGLRHGMAQPAQFFIPMSPRVAVFFAAGMAVLFLGGTAVALWLGHGQRQSWVPLDAHVDSADVVRANHGTWAVRQWLSYTVRGRSYRAPLTASFATSNYQRQLGNAAAMERQGVLRVFADPSHPYFVVSSSQRTGSTIVLPLVFGGIGAVLLWVAWLLHQWNTRSPRARRSRRR